MIGVQPVGPEAYDAVVLLGTKGGWDGLLPQGKKAATSKPVAPVKPEAEKHRVSDKQNKRATPAVKPEPENGERRSKRLKR